MIEFVVYVHDTLLHSVPMYRGTNIIEAFEEFEFQIHQTPEEYDECVELEMDVNDGEDYVTLCEHWWTTATN